MNSFNLKKWPVIGHQKIVNILNNIIVKQKLPHALLFSGVSGIGKTFVAQNLIKSVQCLGESRPCGECNSCKSIEQGLHPDINVYDSKESLKIKDIRKLKHILSLGASMSLYKICLLTNIEKLTIEAANALLKILEEPSGKAIIILTTENYQKLLPTIVSRCVLFNFLNPTSNEIEKYFSTYYSKSIEKDLLERIYPNAGNRPGVIFKYLENRKKLEEIDNIKKSFEGILSDVSGIDGRLNQATKIAKKEKFEIKIFLESWKMYFRNMMFYKLGLYQKEESMLSEKILKKYSLKKISENIIKINEGISLLSRNINKKLLIENLIISL